MTRAEFEKKLREYWGVSENDNLVEAAKSNPRFTPICVAMADIATNGFDPEPAASTLRSCVHENGSHPANTPCLSTFGAPKSYDNLCDPMNEQLRHEQLRSADSCAAAAYVAVMPMATFDVNG